MEKSVYYLLPVHFRQVSEFPKQELFVPPTRMLHAKCSYWLGDGGRAVLQEFDGQYAYLQLLDIDTPDSLIVSLSAARPDLHALYLLSAEGPIDFSEEKAGQCMALTPKQACFLYLPEGNYGLRVGPGHNQLFTFAFRATIFRKANEPPYHFIQPLVHAHRTQEAAPRASSPHVIDMRSEHLVNRLCVALHPRRLGNDQYILSKVIDLIQFAHEAISAKQGTLQHEERLAKEAYTLLQHYVNEDGQQVRIGQLAAALGRSSRYIQQLLRRHYGYSGHKLKEHMLLEKCKALLADGYSVKACAYICGYSSIEAFHHFFKRHMQENPSSYRARQLEKPR
ncbi:AraC family transcriptional regulator [Sphingobacterium paludis]|uniref:AraC-like DNA-binding protein n=1 Tax=Sphingobacterium paludis TaxID=1476465 RepID=A0A4R7D0P7_9SPHI|nr:helix-turn-helix domain-containing protein [Sphingobacterium paludis]TDS12336.1 AraC-like DNA-binding protein [Sphingobacterium paludis]